MKAKKGFTLVELIIILVILAIISALLIPTLVGYIDEARAKNGRDNDRQQHAGQRLNDIQEPHQNIIDPTAEIAGQRADKHTDDHCDDDGGYAHRN